MWQYIVDLKPVEVNRVEFLAVDIKQVLLDPSSHERTVILTRAPHFSASMCRGAKIQARDGRAIARKSRGTRGLSS